MKKLWTATVSLEFDMAIYAETEQEARKIARKNAWEEIRNFDSGDADIDLKDYPPTGLDNALPWGDFDGPEKTVGELKKELGVEHPLETRMRLLAESLKARAVEP